jgi:transporter family-2 protein
MIAASFWGIIAGICVAVQIGLNNVLGKSAPGLWVTLVSHLGGAIFALLLIVLGTLFTSSVSRETLAQIASAPWYSFAGGIFGVTIVACVLASVRVLPIGTTLAMVVAGQFIASVLLERAGVLGLQPHPIDAARLLGIGLICAGTYLVKGV